MKEIYPPSVRIISSKSFVISFISFVAAATTLFLGLASLSSVKLFKSPQAISPHSIAFSADIQNPTLNSVTLPAVANAEQSTVLSITNTSNSFAVFVVQVMPTTLDQVICNLFPSPLTPGGSYVLTLTIQAGNCPPGPAFDGFARISSDLAFTATTTIIGLAPTSTPSVTSEPTATNPTPTPSTTSTPLPTPPVPPPDPVSPNDLGNGIQRISQLGGPVAGMVLREGIAYVCNGEFLSIVDMTSINSPVVIGRSPSLPGTAWSVALYGDFAYVAVAGSQTNIFVLDISQPNQPRLVGKIPQVIRATAGMGVVGTTLVASNAEDGVALIDISNPTTPTLRGTISITGYVDDLEILGNRLFVISNSGFGSNQTARLSLIGLENINAPATISTINVSTSVRSVAVTNALAILVSGDNRLRLIDISTPSNPREVGSLYIGSSSQGAIAIVDQYAYLASPYSVEVLDIRNPANLVASYSTYADSGAIHQLSVGSQQSKPFLVSTGSRGLQVFDLTTITAPTLVGNAFVLKPQFLATHPTRRLMLAANDQAPIQILDISIANRPITLGEIRHSGYLADAVIEGNFAYVLDVAAAKIQVVDITSPSAPVNIASTSISPSAAGEAIAWSDGYAYVAAGEAGLAIIDVTNPSSPSVRLVLDTPDYAANVSVHNKLAVIADESSGIQIVDITNPILSKIVGSYETPGNATQVELEGNTAWILDSNRIYVVDITSPTSPQLVTTYSQLGNIAHFLVGDNRLYLSVDFFGVKVLDVSQLQAPRQIASYSNNSSGNESNLALANGYVYAGGPSYGLASFALFSTTQHLLASSFATVASSPSMPFTDIVLNIPGNLKYDFESNSFTSSKTSSPTLEHQLRSVFGLAPFPHPYSLTGPVFRDVVFNQGSSSSLTLQRPYTLTWSYAGLNIDDTTAQSLSFVFWDGTAWLRDEANKLDIANKTVRVVTQRLGVIWAILKSNKSVYLPLALREAQNFDLAIANMEVTQGLQNALGTVPLVNDRSTLVRVYITTGQGIPAHNVSVLLSGTRGGVPLPGSPLVVASWAAFNGITRGSLGRSFNFELPKAWLNGSIVLTATVNPNSTVIENNTANNQYFLPVQFRISPPLGLKLIPIEYQHLPTGKSFAGVTQDLISNFVQRSFPVHKVNVSMHPIIGFKGDLGQLTEWARLLNQIAAMKVAEGAPASQVYYGLVPRGFTNNTSGVTTAGFGAIGRRYSIGYADSPETAAHEIGHNFGRQHAPCGNPSNLDPAYPHRGGAIGEYGTDVARRRIYEPSASDLMSYCSDSWFSEYTYQALLLDQVKNGQSNSLVARTSILLRVNFDNAADNSSARLLPLYVLDTIPTMPSDDTDTDPYLVEFVGDQGQVIAVHRVSAHLISEGDLTAKAIVAAIPLPVQPFRELRLKKPSNRDNSISPLLVLSYSMKQPLSSQNVLSDEDQSEKQAVNSLKYVNTAQSLALRWTNKIKPSVPKLLRYSLDQGQSWTVLSLDFTGEYLDLPISDISVDHLLFEVSTADDTPPIRMKISSMVYPSTQEIN